MDLFDGGGEGGSERAISDARLLKILGAFAAPIAANAGAITDNVDALRFARALAEIFANDGDVHGLTRAEVAHQLAARESFAPDFVNSRFDLFEAMGLLQPYLQKCHQDRYVLNPAGLAGLLVFERLGVHGGTDEMIGLLDRARALLEKGAVDRAVLLQQLTSARQLLSVYASALSRLVDTAPMGELIAESRQHDHHRVNQQVGVLNQLVTDRFPGDTQLSQAAYALVRAAQSYADTVLGSVEHVLDAGGASLNFEVLPASAYADAVIEADPTALADVGSKMVTDPPLLWLDPGSVLDAVQEHRPRHRREARPPAPERSTDRDPVADVVEAAKSRRERAALGAELRLQGGAESDETAAIRAMSWRGAARTIAELLAVSNNPHTGFVVEIGEGLFVDVGLNVTYAHTVTLRRSSPSESQTRPAPLTSDLAGPRHE